jgi:hypothetical protein
MVTGVVQTALSAVDGTEFSGLSACPFCGAAELRAHDRKARQFAVLAEAGEEQTIHVLVKRFYCRVCGHLCYAEGPFYPKTRFGSPVVDLCATFTARLPCGRAARVLSAMGVMVDRWSVRNYAARRFTDIPVAEVLGIPLPMSVISLSTLAARTGEGGRIEGAEALAACGFPSAHRAALHGPVPEEEGDERDEEHNKEERQVQEPHDGGERE